MRYIEFWEFCPEDMDKIIAKNKLEADIRQKEPEKFGEVLFPSQVTGYFKGFSIIEATREQIRNIAMFWFPELKTKL